jgi:hypothetical protein
MYNWQLLHNFGIITDKVPTVLFDKLKAECEIARQARYNPEIKKNEMISGLSGNGVPIHYLIEDCRKELDQYVMEKFNEYESHFNYISEFKTINTNMGYATTDPWVNIQEKNEYVPAHSHDGIMAFVIWVKIPYDIKEELKTGNSASCFKFHYSNILGGRMHKIIEVSKEYEGTIMMFPSALVHQVYPFYTSNDNRISISGMVAFDGKSRQ